MNSVKNMTDITRKIHNKIRYTDVVGCWSLIIAVYIIYCYSLQQKGISKSALCVVCIL